MVIPNSSTFDSLTIYWSLIFIGMPAVSALSVLNRIVWNLEGLAIIRFSFIQSIACSPKICSFWTYAIKLSA